LNKEPETYFFFFSFLLFNNANLNKVDEDMDAEFETIEARLQSFIGQFHSEVGVLDRIIHKYKNQHRRSSYFQYLFKVRRDCKLLQTTNLVELVNSSFLVSFSFWICIIIQGAARLLSQVILMILDILFATASTFVCLKRGRTGGKLLELPNLVENASLTQISRDTWRCSLDANGEFSVKSLSKWVEERSSSGVSDTSIEKKPRQET
nr:hypothetical protein [Tanacetum cinerariifolium]